MKEIIPKGSLVVSCQALADEPLHGSNHMAAMAKAAKMGGAKGIRSNGVEDIKAIKQKVDLPIIGLNKRTHPDFDVFITPTVNDALDVSAAGADIVAIDGTNRKRQDNKTLEETITILKENDIIVMADISTYEEGVYAAQLGADYISTTLYGYTSENKDENSPDFEMISKLNKELSVPIVAEGHIKTPEQAVLALEAGAHFIVVGSAITRPQIITQDFSSRIENSLNILPEKELEK